MKISKILEIPSVVALLFLYERGSARYSELVKLIRSRGTLSSTLRELEEDGLARRLVIDTRPIQSVYSLSETGKAVAGSLVAIRKRLASGR